MKKVIYNSTSTRKSLYGLTEEEIAMLPKKFTCIIRHRDSFEFTIVSKSDFLKVSDRDYWGYVDLHDMYIARPDEIEAAEDEEIEAIKSEYAKYKSAAARRFYKVRRS